MNEDLPINLKSCDVGYTPDESMSRRIAVVTESQGETLTDKQLLDYRNQRERFLSWLLNEGKDPEGARGYAPYTVYSDAYRTARFDEWVWDQHGQYHYPAEETDAQAYIDHLAYQDDHRVVKGKLQEGLCHFSKWLHHEHLLPEWEFDTSFSSSGGNMEPRDFLTREERSAIREAALNAGSIPAYDSLTAEERSGWKHHLANALGKCYDDVTRADWQELRGWETTSLVWASLDAGLRPDEVAKAPTSWADPANGVLRIPYQDSTKNEGNWIVSLTDRTAKALERWLVERDQLDRYDGSEHLWLNNRGNPHDSSSLGRIIRRLCDEAGIDYENRQMSWYTIRHSVGTYMTDQRDLKAAKDQLRHKSPKTTMQYDQVSVERRREALDRMG